MNVSNDSQQFMAAARPKNGSNGHIIVLIDKASLLKSWDATASHECFALCGYLRTAAGHSVCILHTSDARQKGRPKSTATPIHELIWHSLADVAACGIGNMARGRLYWSRSMYELLGYEPRDAILSFGEVSEIMHPEDGDLYALAEKVAERKVSQIDSMFRMRHANGNWIYLRAALKSSIRKARKSSYRNCC